MHLVESVDDIKNINFQDNEVALLAQTTLAMSEWQPILDKVKEDEQLQIQYEKALANRRDIKTVRAEVAQIIAAAQKTENANPGKINQNDLEARILAYVRSQGYTANEIQGGDDVDVDLLPDPYGLTTSS